MTSATATIMRALSTAFYKSTGIISTLTPQSDVGLVCMRTFVCCKDGFSGLPLAVGLGKNGVSEVLDAAVVDGSEKLSTSCVGVSTKLEPPLLNDGAEVVGVDAVVAPVRMVVSDPDLEPEGSAAWGAGARRTRWCGGGMMIVGGLEPWTRKPKGRVRARKGGMT